MGRGIQGLQEAYDIFFTAVLIVLAVMVVLCLIRAIIGPRIADRIISVNMMGTMVIVTIAILALMLEEGYLVDICIIYAMISFLAVIVLTKVYMGVYLEKHRKENEEKEAEKSAAQDRTEIERLKKDKMVEEQITEKIIKEEEKAEKTITEERMKKKGAITEITTKEGTAEEEKEHKIMEKIEETRSGEEALQSGSI